MRWESNFYALNGIFKLQKPKDATDASNAASADWKYAKGTRVFLHNSVEPIAGSSFGVSDSDDLRLELRGNEYESVRKAGQESSAYVEIFGNVQQARE